MFFESADRISSKDIRFAIVGCGNIAPFHADAIAGIDGAVLSAVCDSDSSKAERMGLKFSADIYTDYSRMLERGDIDVVNICLPSSLHEIFSIQAANAGKHVIVEKPLDISLEKCDNIIAACDLNGVKLATVFPNRFKHGVRLLKQAVMNGRFGRLTQADVQVKWYRSKEYYESALWRGTWQFDGGGVMMNQAIHYIDILQFLMGTVESVSAKCATISHSIEVEDTAVAVLKFANGALGTVEATTAAYPGQDAVISIHGDEGSAVLQGESIIKWEFMEPEPGDDCIAMECLQSHSSGARDPVADLNSDGHRLMIEDVVGAIKDDRLPEVDGYEGRKAVEIIKAMYRSNGEGGVPVVLRQQGVNVI